MDEDRPKEARKEKDRTNLRWMGAGLEFCGVIAIFSMGGYLLDVKYDSGPTYTLTGFFIGFIGMVYLFYKESKK